MSAPSGSVLVSLQALTQTANPPTIQDVLNAIGNVEARMGERFSGIEVRLDNLAEENKLFWENTTEQQASLHAKVEACACRCHQNLNAR